MKNEHSKYSIVSNLVKNAGYPIWNKSISFSKAGTARNNSGDSDTSVTFIPFVKDSQNFVNSTLIIRSERGDTAFKMIYDFQYKEYTFGVNTDDFTAKDIMNIFITLDKEVFDRRVFQINDGRLIGEDTTETFVAVIDTTTFSARTNVVAPLTICNTVTTYAPCNYVRTTVSMGPCMHEFQIPYCTTVWEATNEFPPGGGGGWVPPPGPCGSNRSPEPCETGWEPYPYQVPALNPCDHVEDLISDNAFKAGVNDFKTKTSDNNEWARYFRTNGFETAIESPSNSCEVEATLNTNNFAPVVCFMHTHNDDCLPIFSPGDFKTLRKLIQKHEDYNHTLLTSKFSFVLVAESGSNSTSADVYVMVIENVELFKTFCGDKVDHLSDLADLEQHYQKNYNIGRGFTTANNELEYLRFLRNIGGDDGTGIRILKANSNLSNYSLLRLNGDGTVVIAEPCI